MTRHTVVMVTTSYPRFPGDTVGTFMEPIARGVAARGHKVHVVAPWHPLIKRASDENGIHFHFFRYMPLSSLNVFGYASALKNDTDLRPSAYVAAPFALLAGWRAAQKVAKTHGATIMHGHWVIPGGVIAATAAGNIPVILSLHGSDIFVAEHHSLARRAAKFAFQRAAWVTACSSNLRQRAMVLGARENRIEVLPYGVDGDRFKPDAIARARVRHKLNISADQPMVFMAGRLVRKKGFGSLLKAAVRLIPNWPTLQVIIAGIGDLDGELRAEVTSLNLNNNVQFTGKLPQDDIPGYLTAADLVVVPSIQDDAGNVDGLPNILMEALASETAVVTTKVGGIDAVAVDGRTALVVPPNDDLALAMAVENLLKNPSRRSELGQTARTEVCNNYQWTQFASRLDEIYSEAARS